eukprot:EG_transcript_19157
MLRSGCVWGPRLVHGAAAAALLGPCRSSHRGPLLCSPSAVFTEVQCRRFSTPCRPRFFQSTGARWGETSSTPPPPTSTRPEDRIWTVPNALTLSRILLTPAICWALYVGQLQWAMGGLVYAAATDALDGYVARRFDQQSALGAKLDPLADKVFVNGVALTLIARGALPLYVLLVFLARDVALIGGYFVYKYYTTPADQRDLRTLFRVDRDSDIQVQASDLSKFNTCVQCVLLVAAGLSLFTESAALTAAVQYLSYAACTLTIASGLHYAVTFSGMKRVAATAPPTPRGP